MFSLVRPALAQGICNPILPIGVGCVSPDNAGGTIGAIVSALVGFVLVVGTIGALLFLMLGALRWITASGDKTKLQSAQDEITHAIIGLVVLASSWAIFILITNFLTIGTGDATIPIPTLEELQTQPATKTGPGLDPDKKGPQ